MINEAPGPINFTMFLTMFGEKLTGTDPEDVIKNAFGCFDEEGTGTCRVFVSSLILLMTSFPQDYGYQCLCNSQPKMSILISHKLILIGTNSSVIGRSARFAPAHEQ